MSQNIWAKWMVAAGLGALTVLTPSLAQATDGAVAADTFVVSAHPATNYGGLSNLYVNSSSTTLIRFDLSSLPIGTTSSQIAKAMLSVYVNRVNTPGLVSVLPVTSEWTESTVTYATIPTWSSAVASFTPETAQQFVLIDVTSLVQGWITTPSGNHGVALTSTAGDILFDSKENDETSHVAHLDITLVYQGLPGIPGAPGLTGASGATGAPGIPGTAGVAGAAGATGATGTTGATGPPAIFKSAWSSSTAYSIGDAVSENGSSFVALLANTDIDPATDVSGSGGHWAVLAAEGATGATGTQGIQGPTGAIGATGAQGPQGATGAIGATGSQGPQGTSGAIGATGAAGATGATGATGTTGATGAAGATGPPVSFKNAWSSGATYSIGDAVSENGSSYIALTGNVDIDPATNVSGSGGILAVLAAEGAIGATGSQGPQGATGGIGATGSQGPQGATGAIGATGSQGPQGATGAIGATGLQGPQGTAGATGATGSQGIQGATGATGATGTNGLNGSAATIAVGTTTTGAAGTSASVTNSGSTSAAVFNFTIPQGAAGSGGGTTTGIPYTTVSRSIGVSEYFNPVQALVAISSPADNIFTWVAEQCTVPSIAVYSKYSEALIVDLQYNSSGSGSPTTSLGLTCSVAANGNGCTATGPVTVNAGSFLIFYITQSAGTAPAGTGTLWTAFTCTPGA